jgi:[acyl-carrier-protein] S-malonyltransferase
MTNFTFAFPGQGSQSVAMLADLAEQFPIVVDTYKEASDALGYDLWALVQQGPAEALNQTDKTQPALLAASVAIWRVWAEQGGELPSVIAGHSLGEYSALVCAGVIEFTDAIKLVELRGQLMQQAVPAGVGAMTAIIGLADDKIAQACEAAAQGEVVSPVNYNSPGQVVIAGNKDAVERAGVLCKEAGAKRALPLPVSVPSHCALMKPAAEKLAIALQDVEFKIPQISVINNVDVIAETDTDKIKDALVRQLYCPVRWTGIIEKMAEQGINLQIEAGPGKVLSGLVRRIDKSFTAQVINDVASLESTLAAVKGE